MLANTRDFDYDRWAVNTRDIAVQKFRSRIIFAVVITLIVGLQSQAFAQSYGKAFTPLKPQQVETRTTGKPPAPNAPAGAFLQGASCGTIGPQGGDAVSIMGINTAARERPRPPETFPMVPTFLISMLSLSGLVFGIRTLIAKKRVELWLIGSIAAGALLFAGFVWAAVSGPNLTFSLSLVDSARAIFNSNRSCDGFS